MPDLTLQQRFGSSASIDQSGNLVINLQDLTDNDPATGNGDFTNGLGLDVSGLTEANKDQYASRIFWALLQLSAQNQPENNIDETVGIYVTNQGKRNTIRNGVAQIGFSLAVTGYKNDPDGLNLDPDAIGSNSSSGQ